MIFATLQMIGKDIVMYLGGWLATLSDQWDEDDFACINVIYILSSQKISPRRGTPFECLGAWQVYIHPANLH